MTIIYQLYVSLLRKYGAPRKFWKKWCQVKKTREDQEEIVIGAILTQRTNWLNVALALKNLREAKILSLKGIYQAGKEDINSVEKLIQPSGFYKQKAKRLYGFCKFIIEKYGSLNNFFTQDLKTCREKLLELYGIGPETADTILLYAGHKPVFVIDEYTRRFVKKHKLSTKISYACLQQLFQQNLPKDIKIYQDLHAMIVLEGKGTNWDLVSKKVI